MSFLPRTPLAASPARTRISAPTAEDRIRSIVDAYKAWASAANACPVCVVQPFGLHTLAAALDPSNPQLARKLGAEVLARAALQDAIALAADGRSTGATEHVRDALTDQGLLGEQLQEPEAPASTADETAAQAPLASAPSDLQSAMGDGSHAHDSQQ